MDKSDEKKVEQIFYKHKVLSDESDNNTEILVNQNEYDLTVNTSIINPDTVKITGVKDQVIKDIVENDKYNDIKTTYFFNDKIRNKIESDEYDKEYDEEEFVYNILDESIEVDNKGKETVKYKDEYMVVENKPDYTDMIKSFIMTEDSDQYLLIELVNKENVLDVTERILTVKIQVDTSEIAFKPNSISGVPVSETITIDIGDVVEYESKEWVVSKIDGLNNQLTISRINSATGDKIHKSVNTNEIQNYSHSN